MRAIAGWLVPLAALATVLHYRADLDWAVQATAVAVPWSAVIGHAVYAMLGPIALGVVAATVRRAGRLLLLVAEYDCFVCGASACQLCHSRGGRRRLPHRKRG